MNVYMIRFVVDGCEYRNRVVADDPDEACQSLENRLLQTHGIFRLKIWYIVFVGKHEMADCD